MTAKNGKGPADPDKLARDILDYVRRALSSELPAMMPAFYLLPLAVREERGPLSTDGKSLLYCPMDVITAFSRDKSLLAKEFLHVMAHGLLGHVMKRRGQAVEIFDAAADFKAEAFLEVVAPRYFRSRGLPETTRKLMDPFSGMSLEAIYLMPTSSDQAKALTDQASSVKIDDHSDWNKASEDAMQGDDQGIASVAAMWQAAAQKVISNLQGMGQGQGSAYITESYSIKDESSIHYGDFLKNFMECCEMQRIDPDSIDGIWYRTGFEMLGNSTIVEPNEVTEDMQDLHLAVALDTSGSCSGEIMTCFISELAAIIRDCGDKRYVIHLIQCDDEIQKVDVITDGDGFDNIFRGGKVDLSGWGGTDFRPVFDYIEKQRDESEYPPIKGLLYLSDGFGFFPEKAAEYPVWFLIPPDDYYRDPRIPKWINVADIKDDRLNIRD